MNRRDFFKRIGGAAAAVAISPMLDLAEILAPPVPAWHEMSFLFVVVDSPTFEFGFTGFKPGDQETVFKVPVTMYSRQPRLIRSLYGVTA